MTMRWIDNGPNYPVIATKSGTMYRLLCELEVSPAPGEDFGCIAAHISEAATGYTVHRHGFDPVHANTLDEAKAIAVALATLGG